jgi:hypothetical protein
VCGGTSTGTDAGTTSSSSSGGTCALYGQTSNGPADCCSGVPCTAGRCRYP